MDKLEGKTAFITGGGSGIGLGIAKACCKYGMNVVIVDARQEALDEAMAYFNEHILPVRAIKLNVTDREAYARAADDAESFFGNVHLLVNNAGVGGGGPVETMTYNDWDYVVGINLGGVINGIMTFLPRMLKHGEGGHIVSTSSTNGIAATGASITYCTTKFAVAGMMEALATEMQGKGIGASVLVPGPTRTNLGKSSAANRPAHLQNEETPPPPPPPPPDPDFQARMADPAVWMDPVETGERVIRGVRNNDLFIMTHPEFKAGYKIRHDAIMRANPDEPFNEKRWDIIKNFRTVIYNDLYEKQRQIGPPDW
ncbi:MAG TPA: SDR family NAD(P)-dependent oxidoreductase [Dehalococcoidia bacterium]|nr:SDR family NAD(P)-dependent oxidoreductase [Dehalococcoidia bacterium]